MIISSIAAIGKNYEIGIGLELPWHLPDDFSHFKQTTINHSILMGRINFDSIGKPLPKRENIVITRNKYWYRSDVTIANTIEEGIAIAQENGEEELFIIGGGKIYEQTLPLWDKIYLTEVNAEIPEANVFFPRFERADWQVISERHHPADERHQFDFTIREFRRKI